MSMPLLVKCLELKAKANSEWANHMGTMFLMLSANNTDGSVIIVPL